MPTRFRPCIDLHEGRVKQIVGSTLSDDPNKPPETNFEATGSAADFGQLYGRDALTGGHVIMLGPRNEEAALSALRAYPNGLQIGGGINPQNAAKYLDAGGSLLDPLHPHPTAPTPPTHTPSNTRPSCPPDCHLSRFPIPPPPTPPSYPPLLQRRT